MTQPHPAPHGDVDLDNLEGWVRATRLRAGFFAVFFGAAAVQMHVRPFLQDAGFSPLGAAIVLATVYATLGVFRLVAVEPIVRRLGGKTAALGALGYAQFAAVTGVVGYALLSGALPVAVGYVLMIATAVVFGLGGSLLWGGGVQITLDDSAPDEYGRNSQYLYVAAQAGVLVGLVATDWLLRRSGSRGVLFPMWVGAMLAGTVSAFSAGKNVRPHAGPPDNVGLRQLRVLWLPVVIGLSGFGLGIMYGMLNVYAKDLKGLEWMGLITMPFFVTALIANFWAGRLSDAIGRARTIAAGFAAGAAGMLLLVGVKSALAVVVAASLLGVMSALVVTSAVAWVGDMTSAGGRTRLYGQVFCGRDFGTVTAILFGGFLSQGEVDPKWGFLALGILFALSAILSLAIPEGATRAQQQTE